MSAALEWLAGVWTGSALQVGFLVAVFWLMLIFAILAIVSANDFRDEQ